MLAQSRLPDLPITPLLPQLRDVLRASSSVVLQAPPGAGKTTLVPLALLDEIWAAKGRVIMLEPRRLAARAAARRMADLAGEKVGQTVGYRVRLDSAVGPKTRIEVVTAGVFLRQIQDDPSLDGVAAILFDEFHERSLDVDLSLALCLDARRALREDLRLIVMSATLDGGPIARLLEPQAAAPILTSEGKRYPVETRYLPRDPSEPLDVVVSTAVRRALAADGGDLLVFLPGIGDIRRVQRRLEETGLPDVELMPLYSDLPLDKQDAVLRSAPTGRRKVVLATSIAETSLTIEGVHAVIDGGYMRVPRFDIRSGMSSLETVRVSRASADQRRGRAGRLGPGVCYRLWTEAADRGLMPQTPPEIIDADLTPLALELAVWGCRDAKSLPWLDPPNATALAAAHDLLSRIGAVDGREVITREGRQMARLGVHPRLAHMLLYGQRAGLGSLAADIAALLGERDILRGTRDADLRNRLDMLHGGARASQSVVQVAAHWRRQLGLAQRSAPEARAEDVGRLVAVAYPDRVARRRAGGRGQFLLSNGRGAILPETDPLAGSDFLAVAALDGAVPFAHIFLAVPLNERDLRETFADQIHETEHVAWDSREESVQARRQQRFGELVLDDRPFEAPPDGIIAAMLDGIRELGLGSLPWTGELRNLQARVALLRRLDGDAWPDLSDAALAADLERWLAPYLIGITRRGHLPRLDLTAALRAQLTWQQQQEVARLAPTHLTVPSGSRLPIDYSTEIPVVSVRLQEMFGLTQTPAVADGRMPVLLHLLSPAGRPVQVTRDLASFWTNAYHDVKRDLRGQYPKHHWPDDPLHAVPTRRAKRRGQ